MSQSCVPLTGVPTEEGLFELCFLAMRKSLQGRG